MRKHDVRCEVAKSTKCVCRCKGELHNPGHQEGERVEVCKKKRTALDDEPTFTLTSNPPEEIRAWREDGEGRIGSARTNVFQKYVYHSPDGFEWGYGGSGPADFALNILALFVDAGTACLLHQDFKWQFVAVLPSEGGVIERETVLAWIQNKKLEVEEACVT